VDVAEFCRPWSPRNGKIPPFAVIAVGAKKYQKRGAPFRTKTGAFEGSRATRKHRLSASPTSHTKRLTWWRHGNQCGQLMEDMDIAHVEAIR
jgi:hypothetical protein